MYQKDIVCFMKAKSDPDLFKQFNKSLKASFKEARPIEHIKNDRMYFGGVLSKDGNNATVDVGTIDKKHPVAIKHLAIAFHNAKVPGDKDETYLDRFERECQVSSQLDCNFVVKQPIAAKPCDNRIRANDYIAFRPQSERILKRSGILRFTLI